jgi:hypothetical protein
VIESMGEVAHPPIIALVDDLSMLEGLSLPVVAAMQDVPLLAESAVNLLLPQLESDADGKKATIKPIVLQSRLTMNQAFQARLQHKE